MMNKARYKRLEKAGWKVGTVAEFLGLSEAESEYIELMLALSDDIKPDSRESSDDGPGILLRRFINHPGQMPEAR